MKKALIVGGAFLAVGFATAPLQAAEKPAPELPFIEWSQGQASLEDYKGLLTAIVFFDDSRG